jgi:NADPH:quinone reductase-like Zn-dependent oxidoreductase
MQLERVAAIAPGHGEVRLKQTAVGLNYIDLHCRSGFYPLLKTPGIPGMEAVGTVVDTGPGVAHLSAGQRVGYACMPVGAYASVRTMSSDLVIPLPDFLDDRHAAAVLLKGMTAEFLLHRVHRLQAGETALIFAPAGGVGQLLCQWARHLGATVIGATSTKNKAIVARHAGAHHVIVPGKNSLEEQVLELTDGSGVNVIYDAVGADTWRHSTAALAVRGHLVSFGQASGSVGSRDIDVLTKKSLTISRPNFNDYVCTREMLSESSARLFSAIAEKTLTIALEHSWALSAASDAHSAMQGRETVGSSVLIPGPEE